MKRFLAWINAVPHLFGKIMVWVCVLGGSASIAWSFRILSRTDNDPAPTLIAALGFFGGELLTMAKRKTRNDPGGKEEL